MTAPIVPGQPRRPATDPDELGIFHYGDGFTIPYHPPSASASAATPPDEAPSGSSRPALRFVYREDKDREIWGLDPDEDLQQVIAHVTDMVKAAAQDGARASLLVLVIASLPRP